MRRSWPLFVLCTGCLQPNPKFVADAGTGSESANETGSSSIGSDSAPTVTSSTLDGTSTDATSVDVTTTDVDAGTTTVSTSSTTAESTGAAGEHTMFVSSVFLHGDFGGTAAADDMCQQLADAANFGGTWTAVVSDTGSNARDRIAIGGPVSNLVGELLAEDEADFWDGSLANPVRITDENVELLHTPWTGTNADGTVGADTCNNWSGGGGQVGWIGYSGYSDEGWIHFDTLPCSQSFPIYCISQ